MHLADGILPAPLLITGAFVAALGCAKGIKDIEPERIVKAGVLAGVFFVSGAIRLSLGGVSSMHLSLTGLLGLMLGWSAFGAIAVALFMQAVLLQIGGLASIGVNLINLALPAVITGNLMRPRLARASSPLWLDGFIIGFLPVMGSVIMTAGWLAFSNADLKSLLVALPVYNLPVALVEGVILAMMLPWLHRADLLPKLRSIGEA